jgi:hypothetical protein
MSAPILLQPKPQFCDANGRPYAGGSITTYVKGTTTPKTTWKDPGQAATNTNPITLDAAGQCDMWGDGDYQLELHDAAGTLIWSAPSTTVVSAAMYPVVSATTTLDATNALGIPALIAVETDRAMAVEADLYANDARFLQLAGGTMVNDGTNDGSLFLEHDPVSGMEASNKRYVDDGVARLEIADANLQAQINTISGAPVTNMQGAQSTITIAAGASSAVLTLTFPRPFATACDAIVVTSSDSAIGGTPAVMSFSAVPLSATQATIVAILPAPLTPVIIAWTAHFNYIAIGH